MEVRDSAVFQIVQVEAMVQIFGRGRRLRFRLILSARICRWRRQCTCLVEDVSGDSDLSSSCESAGGGGSSDGW